MYSDTVQKSGLKLNLGLKTIVLFFILLTNYVYAQSNEINESYNYEQNGLIEVHYDVEVDVPYRERRTNWSFVFGISQELFYPEKLKASDGTFYKDIFGKSDIKLNLIEVGTKYNLAFGAIFATLNSSAGNVREASLANQATLDITKNAFSVGIVLDTIFEEPYLAPYLSLQTHYIHYDYIDPLTSFAIKDTTGISSGMRIGSLIQLNWLDVPGVDLKANKEWGLDNTFLDIYMSQYNTTADKETPDFQTSYNYGVGVQLEF